MPKEWDSSVYQRKYEHAWVRLRYKDGKEQTEYVRALSGMGNGKYGFLLGPDGDKQIGPLHEDVEPLYFPFTGGYYRQPNGNIILLERRTDKKHFKQGVSGDSWSAGNVDIKTGQYSPLKVDALPKTIFNQKDEHWDEVAVNHVGVADRMIAFGVDKVFAHRTTIGIKNQDRVVLSHKSYMGYLKRHLPTWQIR